MKEWFVARRDDGSRSSGSRSDGRERRRGKSRDGEAHRRTDVILRLD